MNGAPSEVRYDPKVEIRRVFFLAEGTNGLAAWYFLWRPDIAEWPKWGQAVEIPGPDLQVMTPPVIAWNGNDTRLDIFAVSRANSHLLHASWDAETDKWTEYEDLHGCVTTPPVAVSRRPGIIDVFARGGDGGLWQISYDDDAGKWSSWSRISGDTKISGQPDVISIDSDSLDVFARSPEGAILHKSFDVASNTWSPDDGFAVIMDGGFSGPPKVISDGPGRIHVFVYNDDNQLVGKTMKSQGNWNDPMILADVPMLT
ncbi:hypothetical protein F4777DRAFT_570501 [Nemania sp. FL0916]|nr:hypothetical protein F4777DRAFT_570501 [Nemania sp. FL0916]